MINVYLQPLPLNNLISFFLGMNIGYFGLKLWNYYNLNRFIGKIKDNKD